MRNLLMSAIILACSSALAPAVALNDEERQQIDKQIEDFFMRNPEKLERALDNMQFYLAQRAEQQRAQALLANADNLYRNPSDYSMGPKNAPITIVEFSTIIADIVSAASTRLCRSWTKTKMCASCLRNIRFWAKPHISRPALLWRSTIK